MNTILQSERTIRNMADFLPGEHSDIRIDVCEMLENAEEWLSIPNSNYAGRQPKELIGTGAIMYYMIHATDHPEGPIQMARAYRNTVRPLIRLRTRSST